MGMFDTLILAGSRNHPVTCAAGHPLTTFQTKDFDCTMAEFYVWNNVLYKFQHESRRAVELSFEVIKNPLLESQNDQLVITTRTFATLHYANYPVVAYTHCGTCLPVLIEADVAWERVREITPWCEFEFVFDGAKFVKVNSLRVDTRDELKLKYVNHIPDTDRVAVRHFEKCKKEKP